MNKKILYAGLLVITVVMAFAFTLKTNKNSSNSGTANIVNASKNADESIRFIEGDWNKALAEAKKQNKPIFLDAYTSWCGPCKMLKRNTFTDKAAAEYFNKNFINVALDMEKGDGIAVGEKYQIRAYPTLIITDADQKSVTISEGYINPDQLIEFGKYVIDKKK